MSKIQQLRPKDASTPYTIKDLDNELICMAMVRSLGDEWMAIDSKTAPDPIFEPCLAGKMHANPFPTSSWRASRPLELVHSDVHDVGHISMSGFRYWITFIDDYSRFRFVIPLKAKSQAFEAFKTFKAFAENQSEQKIGRGVYDQCLHRFHHPMRHSSPAHCQKSPSAEWSCRACQ